jgi:two-component system cell cycle sensor histidine kinase/response regulator CckA
VMLAVSDSGTGMDAETQSHLFEPFFTTKPVGHGTGLGLSTVYGIVKQSGGYIWVYSELGVGTTFKIYFPRIDDEVAEVAPEESEAAPAERGSETVLLVEDEEALREVMREVLEDTGYTVLTARDGVDAIRVSNAHPRPIHVMVIDLMLPGMGGRSAALEITAARPDLKTLYISGYSTEAVLHHGMLSRGSAFLSKPFTSAGLLRSLRELVTGTSG